MIKPLFDPMAPNIVIYDQLDSTSLQAKKMVRSGFAEHGLIIWAKKQLHGYGRYGREWQSENNNLTFSFVIENKRTVESIAVYPFIAALAIRESLQQYLTETQMKLLSFKWPNDILYDGKKIAGVIFESEIQNGQINSIVCGIGINVSSSPQEFNFATSLVKEGLQNIANDKLLCSIMLNIDKYLLLADKQGDQVIYNQWLNYAYNFNEQIIVISNNEEIRGIFTGIEDGNIIIEDKNKQKRKLYTGDVFFSDKEKITTIMQNSDISNITILKPHKSENY